MSGKPLGEFYNDKLFAPLSMRATRLVDLEEAIKMQVDPENSPTPGNLSLQRLNLNLLWFADGGVVSTNGDIIKWHKGLHNGQVLSKESYKLIMQKHYEIPDKNGRKTYIGYGLFYIRTVKIL